MIESFPENITVSQDGAEKLPETIVEAKPYEAFEDEYGRLIWVDLFRKVLICNPTKGYVFSSTFAPESHTPAKRRGKLAGILIDAGKWRTMPGFPAPSFATAPRSGGRASRLCEPR